MRNLFSVASLAALIAISNSSVSIAASSGQKANVSYASNTSRASEPVPANCVRQECGKLWCWQMGHSKTSSR